MIPARSIPPQNFGLFTTHFWVSHLFFNSYTKFQSKGFYYRIKFYDIFKWVKFCLLFKRYLRVDLVRRIRMIRVKADNKYKTIICLIFCDLISTIKTFFLTPYWLLISSFDLFRVWNKDFRGSLTLRVFLKKVHQFNFDSLQEPRTRIKILYIYIYIYKSEIFNLPPASNLAKFC